LVVAIWRTGFPAGEYWGLMQILVVEEAEIDFSYLELQEDENKKT
jgi:hypothetical protein